MRKLLLVIFFVGYLIAGGFGCTGSNKGRSEMPDNVAPKPDTGPKDNFVAPKPAKLD